MVTGASESCGISVGPDQQCEYPPDIPSTGITHLLPFQTSFIFKAFYMLLQQTRFAWWQILSPTIILSGCGPWQISNNSSVVE